MDFDFKGLIDSLLYNWQATSFLAIIVILAIATVVLFVLSIRAQKVYDTDMLPMLPGMSDEVEEEVVVLDESDEGTLFVLDDEEESLPDLNVVGDKESEDLLKAVRAASAPKTKKKSWNIFQKKS